MKSQSLTQKLGFIGTSDTRVSVSPDRAALMRLSHEQTVQMSSQRCLRVTTGDSGHIRAHAAKSSTAQAPGLRPVGRKSSRARHTRRRTAAKLATFMTRIRRLMKAYAVLRQELCARFSEHAFDHGNRVPVSSAATHLDIRDRVSMQTGRLSQVPRWRAFRAPRATVSASSRDRAPAPEPETVTTSHATEQQPSSTCRIKGGSSEPQII